MSVRRSIILPGQKTSGWPKPKKLRELPTDEISNILVTHWREDVHFCQYAVIPEIGAYRYNNEIFTAPEFEEYKKQGGAIEIVVVAFDVDSPAKKSGEPGALDIWFEEERKKIENLRRAFPGGMVWRTKGGWRGCWYYNRRISTPDDTALWRKDYLATCVYLERDFGIIVDSSCNDWNRLHRVPFGIRNTEAQFGWGDPEVRETFGRLDISGKFDISAVPSSADRDEAKRRHISAWRSPPRESTKSKNIALADEVPKNLPILVGQSVWERYLRAVNALIRELGPGKWAVICPNAAQHSTVNETSTVLYAPGPGEILGHPHCSHGHCQGLDWKTAYGILPEEWGVLTAEVLSELPKVDPAIIIAGDAAEKQEDPETAERRVVAGLIAETNGLRPAGISQNVTHLLVHHPFWRGRLFYDSFKHERYWTSVPEFLANLHKFDRRVLDADVAAIQGWLLRGSHQTGRPPISASIDNTRIGLTNACQENTIDSLRNYVLRFDGIWDGTPRLDSWLIDYMGADDTPLNRAIGKRWLIAAVARALHPGCVADMMPILEGEQEIGKNYMLEIMFGIDFMTVPYGEKLGTKDFEQKCADTWCVHDDELACTSKAGLEAIKSWLTQKTAKFRKAFERDFATVPRRFIIVGSTNKSNYLTDEENRRFWPIYLRKLKAQALINMREQLWSEALAYFSTNTEYRIMKSDQLWSALETQHDSRKNPYMFDERIQNYLDSGVLKPPFQLWHVMEIMGISPEKYTNVALMMHVGMALKRLGLKSELRRFGTGQRGKWWVHPTIASLSTSLAISPNPFEKA